MLRADTGEMARPIPAVLVAPSFFMTRYALSYARPLNGAEFPWEEMTLSLPFSP